ncbi:MAG TPA: TlpA disulfide reductase family protein [Candidatus Polarisedimenticolia bacterium]
MPRQVFRAGPAAAAVAILISCSAGEPPAGRDAAALRDEYHRIQQQALVELRAWGAGNDRNVDPRPRWAEKLEAFATAHPEAPEAAEALEGVLQLREGSRDIDGFFKAYKTLLEIAPDSNGLPSVFEQVKAMRVLEAGGPTIMSAPDDEARRRAYRTAAPHIAADLERAVAAAKRPATLAAAHLAIGETWFLFDLDLGKALKHFKVVATQFADASTAAQAREYVAEIETLGPGRPAPDFEAVTVDGKKIRLSSLKGSIVLIDFWATWCMPCLVELPNLRRAYERFHGRGFVILGVSIESDSAEVSRFAARKGMTWPILVDGAEGNMATGPVARAYNVQSIPMSYLVDRDGTIRARRLLGDGVERAVADLLVRRVAALR